MSERHVPPPAGNDAGDDAGAEDHLRAVRAGERRIAVCWLITMLASLALAGVYLAGGQPQLEGSLLFVALGSLGAGFVILAHDLLPGQEATGSREDLGSSGADREAAEAAFARGEEVLVRRSFLLRILGMAAGALGIAALFPINSLGPQPKDTLGHTTWANGLRLVTEDGRPVKDTDLKVNGVLTVFPEGHTDDADAQTILINVGDAPRRVRRGREGWAVGGYVAFSKVCTHAGCPVGLYRSTNHELLCPCHQSTFDVLDGCRPVFGPAARSLPQLPLAVNTDGYLIAQSDFTEPVGPGYWNRR
jgi:ubiquinol-cytochrome c reductase iron-sulfur subunit